MPIFRRVMTLRTPALLSGISLVLATMGALPGQAAELTTSVRALDGQPDLAQDNMSPLINGGSAVAENRANPGAVLAVRQGKHHCSAFRISPTWVVSARHCIEDPGGQAKWEIDTIFTEDVRALTGAKSAVKRTLIAPTADTILMELAEATPGPIAAWSDAPLEPREAISFYGWGRTTEMDTGKPSDILKVGTGFFSGEKNGQYFGGVNAMIRSTVACPMGGDSGGPMFNAKGQAVADLSFGLAQVSARNCIAGYVPLAQNKDWIVSTTGVKPGGTSYYFGTPTLAHDQSTSQVPEPMGGAQTRVTGGEIITDQSRNPGAVLLEQKGQHHCSAFRIAPTWVVSARHCVDHPVGGNHWDIDTVYTDSVKAQSGPKATVKRTLIAPTADTILLELNEATPGPIAAWTASPMASREQVKFYGWGNTGTPRPPYSDMLKTGNGTYTGDKNGMYFGGTNVMIRGNGSCPLGGDSGGPLFNAQGQAVGDLSFGLAQNSAQQCIVGYVPLMQNKDWIVSNTGVQPGGRSYYFSGVTS